MSSIIETSVEQSFIRLCCSGYLTLEDHYHLFCAVHDRHRSGLSLQNYIETVKPEPRQVVPYVLKLLGMNMDKSKDKMIFYLLNYVFGISQDYMENLLQNEEENSQKNKKPKIKTVSYFGRGILDVQKQSEPVEIDNRKLFYFMITMYRNRNLKQHEVECVDRYIKFVTISCPVDSCISKLFQIILCNRQITVSHYQSFEQSYEYLHSTDVLRLIVNQISGFKLFHFTTINTMIDGCKNAMACGNKQALAEIINILVGCGKNSKSNIFRQLIIYKDDEDDEDEDDDLLDEHEVSMKHSISSSMIDELITVLNVPQETVYKTCVSLKNDCESTIPKDDMYIYFSLRVKLYQHIKVVDSELANSMLPNLLNNWQEMVRRCSVVTNETLKFVQTYVDFDDFNFSISIWQNLVNNNLHREVLDEKKFFQIAKELLSLPSHRLPCWVTNEAMENLQNNVESVENSVEENCYISYVLNGYYVLDGIVHKSMQWEFDSDDEEYEDLLLKLCHNVLDILTPPPFSEFSNCEQAILNQNENEFWTCFHQETNFVIKQRCVLLLCALGNVKLLSKISSKYINPNMCWFFGMINKQREILDLISINFKIDINCTKIIELLRLSMSSFTSFDTVFMNDYLIAEQIDFKKNDDFCNRFCKQYY